MSVVSVPLSRAHLAIIMMTIIDISLIITMMIVIINMMMMFMMIKMRMMRMMMMIILMIDMMICVSRATRNGELSPKLKQIVKRAQGT